MLVYNTMILFKIVSYKYYEFNHYTEYIKFLKPLFYIETKLLKF